MNPSPSLIAYLAASNVTPTPDILKCATYTPSQVLSHLLDLDHGLVAPMTKYYRDLFDVSICTIDDHQEDVDTCVAKIFRIAFSVATNFDRLLQWLWHVSGVIGNHNLYTSIHIRSLTIAACHTAYLFRTPVIDQHPFIDTFSPTTITNIKKAISDQLDQLIILGHPFIHYLDASGPVPFASSALIAAFLMNTVGSADRYLPYYSQFSFEQIITAFLRPIRTLQDTPDIHTRIFFTHPDLPRAYFAALATPNNIPCAIPILLASIDRVAERQTHQPLEDPLAIAIILSESIHSNIPEILCHLSPRQNFGYLIYYPQQLATFLTLAAVPAHPVLTHAILLLGHESPIVRNLAFHLFINHNLVDPYLPLTGNGILLHLIVSAPCAANFPHTLTL